MSRVYPWIYVDYANNIWKFFQNNNKELCYTIMYEEGKWTKESLIDKEVLDFTVYITNDETIHIVYSNINGNLKYCTMKNKQWLGKKLSQIESDEFEIQNLKVEIIGDEMHIFYLLIGNDGSDHGVLMHCIWNGKETTDTSLQDIILIPNLNEHYSINVTKKNNINVFFITDEGDEVSLNYCSFENHRWSTIKRLYGIQGDDICFDVLMNQQDIHILNKSREDSIYFLDHVCIDISGEIQEFKVHESSSELVDPLLFIKNNKLYSCWLEQGRIFYSGFDDEKWNSAVYFNRGDEHKIERYNCFICCDNEDSIKARKVYGTNEVDLCLFIPSQFAINTKDSLKYEVSKVNADTPSETEIFQSLKLELSRVKSENKILEKKIASLSMQAKKKQRFIEEYEERVARILEQKRKVDENCALFFELKQNIQKELEVTKQKFLEEELLTTNLKNELKEIKKQLSERYVITENYQRELENTKEQLSQKEIFIVTLQKELEDTKEKLLGEQNIKTSIENKLKECESENLKIRQQVETITEENKKLYEELKFEKNQSIMERLLRKRSSGM
ncbi:hypothetical protein JMF89_10565 [Clostridiaceae bacterium UIB06]|uniref:Uncharacterized protein n=1 Tax=Clostridium thailandense TaxID=2794346 RepID=A0A949TWL9_9CLOT|nr:hypothetical protein [Clostridium thailandense]MBV7272815.1 hypothetical protein [Clostridium thailandense]MCH5137644.1 hypothetical protein [Clostridiaceae bacterium UIB06]